MWKQVFVWLLAASFLGGIRAVAENVSDGQRPREQSTQKTSPAADATREQANSAADPKGRGGPASTKAPGEASRRSANLINGAVWNHWGKGFRRQGGMLVCDNGGDTDVARGAGQWVHLNQAKPEPVYAVAWSKAEGVTGKPDGHYSLYLDVFFDDGTALWGQYAGFSTGTHDWQRRQVVVVPEKPIRVIGFYLLLRRHGGKAWFLPPELYVGEPPEEPDRPPLPPSARESIDTIYNLSKDDPTVAVVDLVDQGPSLELAVLRTAFAEMLSGDLAQHEGIRVVERTRVDQFLREASLQEGFVDAATVQRAGEALAAKYLITGTFQAREGAVHLSLALHEVGQLKPRAIWDESPVPLGELPKLERRLAGEILASLGIDEPKRRAPPEPKPGPSPVTAVLALKNLSPSARLAALERGFAEILQANLAALPEIVLVERDEIHEILKEQELSLSGLVDPATALRVGGLLGAERLIYGSFVELGDRLRIELRLADTQTGTVLRAESATGPTEDFATLIEDLALRLAADLAIRPPENAEQLVRGATPSRKLESAIHLANGEEAFHHGRYAEAAAHYERLLLIEPNNAHAMLRRMQAWYFQKEYDKAIEAGEEMLARNLAPQRGEAQSNFFHWLRNAYSASQRYEDYIDFCRRVMARYPDADFASSFEINVPFALLHAGRRSEGVAVVEENLQKAQEVGDSTLYANVLLRTLRYYYIEPRVITASREYQSRQHDPEYVRNVSLLTWQSAARANELFELILKEAEGKQTDPWRWWAKWSTRYCYPRWISREGGYRRFLSEEQAEKRWEDIIRVFGWNRQVALEARQALAHCYLRQHKWQEAADAFLELVKEVHIPTDTYTAPDWWDLSHFTRTSPRDRRIEFRYRAADIYHHHLDKKWHAELQYRLILENFGHCHHRAVEVIRGLHELGKQFPVPDRAALVWGGGDQAYRAWKTVLEPKGFKVHRLAQHAVTAGHLAPYDLVVLVRTGTLPYAPADILALRSYVATGGALLVVVSPGWEPAQPGIHAPLLSLFGVRPGHEMVVYEGTRPDIQHPITKGMDWVRAKNPVHLEVPPGTEIVKTDTRTVLAAIPYRSGRVVVASLGQWFMPDLAFRLKKFEPLRDHWTRHVPPRDLPFSMTSAVHVPMLRQAVDWLVPGPSANDADAAIRKQFKDARLTSLKVQFGVLPKEALKNAMDRLIAEAGPGTWREEALWTAGEAFLRLNYFSVARIDFCHGAPRLGWPKEYLPPAPEPEYFRRLIDEFPQSPLRPYAQWRLAECERCRPMYQAAVGELAASDHVHSVYQLASSASAIPLYQKVEARKGSYPWAWTQIRLGQLYFGQKQFEQAAECFRQIAETLDHCPEKSTAVLNLATCYHITQNHRQAERWYEMALSEPDICWGDTGLSDYSQWCPLQEDGTNDTGTTREIVKRRLQSLNIGPP